MFELRTSFDISFFNLSGTMSTILIPFPQIATAIAWTPSRVIPPAGKSLLHQSETTQYGNSELQCLPLVCCFASPDS